MKKKRLPIVMHDWTIFYWTDEARAGGGSWWLLNMQKGTRHHALFCFN